MDTSKLDIPKRQIERLMDRTHVYTSDAEIKAEIRRRAVASYPMKRAWTEEEIVAAENYAVAVMAANRKLCRDYGL